MTYLTPGIYSDIPMAEYLADELTPEPALSASGIRTLIEETPLEFATRNPRLWPFPWAYEERGGTKSTAMGEAIHSLLLGKGSHITVIRPGDYLTKKGEPGKNLATEGAKQAIAEAEANGLIVLSDEQNIRANRSREYAEKKILANPLYGEAWRDAESEVTLIWRRITRGVPCPECSVSEPAKGMAWVRPEDCPSCKGSGKRSIWCRARPDRLSLNHGIIFDPKTTALSISDDALSRRLSGLGTDYQAAWNLDGLETLAPELRGRAQFRVVPIEQNAPYDSRFMRFPETTMGLVAQAIDIAVDRFARCLANGEWPGYDHETHEATLPEVGWHERRLEEMALIDADREDE